MRKTTCSSESNELHIGKRIDITEDANRDGGSRRRIRIEYPLFYYRRIVPDNREPGFLRKPLGRVSHSPSLVPPRPWVHKSFSLWKRFHPFSIHCSRPTLSTMPKSHLEAQLRRTPHHNSLEAHLQFHRTHHRALPSLPFPPASTPPTTTASPTKSRNELRQLLIDTIEFALELCDDEDDFSDCFSPR